MSFVYKSCYIIIYRRVMLFSQVIGTISKARILKILMPTSPRMTIENYAAKTHTSITYTNIIDDIHGYRTTT